MAAKNIFNFRKISFAIMWNGEQTSLWTGYSTFEFEIYQGCTEAYLNTACTSNDISIHKTVYILEIKN